MVLGVVVANRSGDHSLRNQSIAARSSRAAQNNAWLGQHSATVTFLHPVRVNQSLQSNQRWRRAIELILEQADVARSHAACADETMSRHPTPQLASWP